MSNIADVIAWKFSNQPGMRCLSANGVLTISEFPGGIPAQATQDTWTAEYQAFVDAGGLDDAKAAADLDMSKISRLLFEVSFNLENRVRTLESRPPVTRPQYRTALLTTLKGL